MIFHLLCATNAFKSLMSFPNTCGFLRHYCFGLLMPVCINAMSNIKFFDEEKIEAAVFSIVYHLMIDTLH